MRIQGTCSMCGQPGHRYGTTDPEHEYDAMGCVNMLRPALEATAERLERVEGALREIADLPTEMRRHGHGFGMFVKDESAVHADERMKELARAALTPENPDPKEVDR